MHEIYRNTTQFVTLDIYGGTADGTPDAVVLGETPYVLPVNGPEVGADYERWTATLPLDQTQNIGPLEVVWTFTVDGQAATKTNRYDVVLPLVELDDIAYELEVPPEVSREQLMMLERRVRKMIEAHTQQEFAPRISTETVTANGGPILSLQKRLVSVTSLQEMHSMLSWGWYTIVNDGWGLRKNWGYQGVVTANAPIHAPSLHGRYAEWSQGIPWNITGVWGYTAVPSKVHEAALVLMEQRLCNQAAYRDNYLSSMKASDWRFDYFQEAIHGTGNVVADQLLEEYINHGAAVV